MWPRFRLIKMCLQQSAPKKKKIIKFNAKCATATKVIVKVTKALNNIYASNMKHELYFLYPSNPVCHSDSSTNTSKHTTHARSHQHTAYTRNYQHTAHARNHDRHMWTRRPHNHKSSNAALSLRSAEATFELSPLRSARIFFTVLKKE